MENNYIFFDELIPQKCKITDLGCGYGFLIQFLAQSSSKRELIGIDFDQDKIEIAKNVSLSDHRTQFYNANLKNYDPLNSDVFIINDVLHYLNKESRNKLLKKVYTKLNVKGMIIIREGDQSLEKKHKITKLSEVFSTYIGFNKAKFSDLEFLDRAEIINIGRTLGATVEIVDDTQFTSNIIYILKNEG